MKKIIGLFITMILAAVVLAGCGEGKNDNAGENKTLVMATSADYAPFEYIESDKSDEIIGFDVDLAKAITGKLGYEMEIKDMDFGGLIQSLKSGQADFVLAGMTPTEKRKKNVDFSDIYYTAQHMIISKKDNGIEKVEDLKGKTVGVQLGSIQEGKADEINKTVAITVENRNRIPELIQELKAGRFDAIIIEDTVAKGYLEKEADFTSFTISDDPEEAGSAIAFPKDSELTDKFNKELQKMKENGELQELIAKWFGGEN
ncbi:transporter substrate-binding domain-containing protein [Bacillus sp. EB106-08-02-XG196]|jgi:arginine/lysine/histidine transporter system substrate-binding protein|uniref:transporter substrate-binding domain-containing protein n=1 Tax=Bacillus sp. EB106-08-02-XG196 TaxID=2737049 RepID=UPI0015C48EB6|nr:transporter substrate-binding domain-containing protein [Bacillus sp. EB106-08-02-XG196]NWQ39923.1 transporter substrate-binding domain-containing protein [Bacillus sp. EB106-08-02-XG196]